MCQVAWLHAAQMVLGLLTRWCCAVTLSHCLYTAHRVPLSVGVCRVAQEHMSCETIQTRFRPVPLHWHFSYYKDKRVSIGRSAGHGRKGMAGTGPWMTEVAVDM